MSRLKLIAAASSLLAMSACATRPALVCPSFPPPTGQSIDADSGLAFSAIAKNDIENAAEFHLAVEEVKAWRNWHSIQAELWARETRAPTR